MAVAPVAARWAAGATVFVLARDGDADDVAWALARRDRPYAPTHRTLWWLARSKPEDASAVRKTGNIDARSDEVRQAMLDDLIDAS